MDTTFNCTRGFNPAGRTICGCYGTSTRVLFSLHKHLALPNTLLTATAKSVDRVGPATKAPSRGAWDLREERGVSFVTGNAFYRAESCAGRDLAILAAALHRRRTGRLRVLDVMAGSGMRGARYLVQADADEVWVNDGSTDLHGAMVYNLCAAAGMSPPASASCQVAPPLAQAAVPQRGTSKTDAGSTAAETIDDPALHLVTPPGRTLREFAEFCDGQAQRLRLEGLARDVWQWDLPRTPGHVEDPLLADSPAAATTAALDAGLKDGRGSGRGSPPDVPTSASDTVAPGVGGSESPTPLARRIRISHADANRLLTNCYMRESYYDLVDVDSFGSETMHFPAAVDAVRYGGLLYLTSTDGFTSSGKRPERGLAAYGSYARATPWANEQGLRMLVGAAVREAAARGVTLTPVFSLYSYHGPVFRVMLRATRSAEWHSHHYGFIGHCFVHGDNYTVGWRSLGAATCRCETRSRRRSALHDGSAAGSHTASASACADQDGTAVGTNGLPGGLEAPAGQWGSSLGRAAAAEVIGKEADPHAAETSTPARVSGAEARRSGTPLVLSGPLWTGPLHDAAELRAMSADAAQRGWTGFGLDATAAPHLQNRKKSSRNVRPLEELMEIMLEEADPRLPPGFFSIDDSVARRMARPPPRDALIAALREEGFAAARCHLEARAFRTDACMEDVLRVAEERLGIPRRR